MVRAGKSLANKSARHFGPKRGCGAGLAESRFDVADAFGRRRRSLNPFHGIFRRSPWAVFCLLAATVHAAFDPPAAYYSTATGLSGSALKAALHELINGHTVLPYTSGSTDVWDALMVLDADPNNSANVILLYSGESRSKTLRKVPHPGILGIVSMSGPRVWVLSTKTTRPVVIYFICSPATRP